MEGFDGHCLRGGAARVETGDLAGFGVAVHDKEVAADAAHHGFDDAEDGVGGDGGVDGATALGEDLGAGLGGEDLAGGDNAAGGDDHGASVGPVRFLGGEEGGGDEEEERGFGHGVWGRIQTRYYGLEVTG